LSQLAFIFFLLLDAPARIFSGANPITKNASVEGL